MSMMELALVSKHVLGVSKLLGTFLLNALILKLHVVLGVCILEKRTDE